MTGFCGPIVLVGRCRIRPFKHLGRAVLIGVLGAAPAGADERWIIELTAAPDACPAPASLWSALHEALPQASAGGGGSTGGIAVELVDLGDRYRIVVGDDQRTFVDAFRRCEERARAAAVFVALTLEAQAARTATPPADDPPARTDEDSTAELPAAAPLAIEQATAPAIARRSAPSRPSLSVDLEGAPMVATAAASPAQITAGGRLGLGMSLGHHLGVAAGVAGFGPAALSVGAGRVALVRLPFDLDLRAHFRRGRVEGVFDGGVAIASLWLRGEGFSENGSAVRFDVGVRVGIQARWWLGDRFALHLALEAVGSPQRHDLLVGSRVAGAVPRMWLSGALGVTWRLH